MITMEEIAKRICENTGIPEDKQGIVTDLTTYYLRSRHNPECLKDTITDTFWPECSDLEYWQHIDEMDLALEGEAI